MGARGAGLASDTRKGGPESFYGSLIPFDNRTLDSFGLEKSENIWGSVVRVFGGGGSGMSRNPNDDGTESIVLDLAVGDETSCLDSGVTNLTINRGSESGSDNVPGLR